MNSSKCLDCTGGSVADGTQIIQYSYWGGANQQWTLTDLGTGLYQVKGVQSGRVLAVSGGATAPGTKIELWDWDGTNSQRWNLYPAGGGYYKFSPANAPGMGLDVYGSSTANGAIIQLNYLNGGQNQLFKLQAP